LVLGIGKGRDRCRRFSGRFCVLIPAPHGGHGAAASTRPAPGPIRFP
jgi:hypothetical protein